MTSRTIYMTKDDAKQLQHLLNVEKASNKFEQNTLQTLEAELNQGTLVEPNQVPGDVILMNSTVTLLDLDTEEELVCKLVFPDNADIDQNKISVLAPIGTAMLGHSVGDTFEWKTPAGLRRLNVKEILS